MQIATDPNAAFQTRPSVEALNAGIQPEATSSGSSSSSSAKAGTSTATITANDFLQLLVTELQNQDPTANTDPNEYVNQLVQVNTLQQQIQMNQTLDGGPSLTGANSGVLQQLMNLNYAIDGGASQPAPSARVSPGRVDASSGSLQPATASTGNSTGNLSASGAAGNGAAEAVATALTRHASPPKSAGKSIFEQFAARLKAAAQ